MRPGPSIERTARTGVRGGGFGRGATSRPVRLTFRRRLPSDKNVRESPSSTDVPDAP